MEWLKARHRDEEGNPRISASEAAAVHGEHRFISKYGLAVAKMADEPVITETNRAMERGNRLEATLLEWLGDEIGIELIEPAVMYTIENSGSPMVATLDGVDKESYLKSFGSAFDLPKVVAEIKTYNREWDGVLPRYWYWQGVHQAICANVDEIVWGIFDSTLDLHVHRQPVTMEEKMLHIGAVTEFVWWIKLGSIPAEWPATYEEVSLAYTESNHQTVTLDEYHQVFTRLSDVQKEKKLLTVEEDELKATVALLLKDNEVGVVDGKQVVSWKEQSRKAFDTKTFAVDLPHLFDAYQKTSTFRVMRFKGEK
jgi:hypothetical protein